MVDIQPVHAEVEDDHLVVELADGRIISTPLDWYPLLKKASPQQRNNIELLETGLHWPDLDEDLSIEGMLAGRPAEDRARLVSPGGGFFWLPPRTASATIRRGRLPAEKVGGMYKIADSDAALWRAETHMGRPSGA